MIPHIYVILESSRRIAYVGKDQGNSKRANLHLRGKDQRTGFFVRQMKKNNLMPEFWCVEICPPDIDAAEMQWMGRCEKEFDLALINKHRPDIGEKEYREPEEAIRRLYGDNIPGVSFQECLGPNERTASEYFTLRAEFALYRNELEYRYRQNRPPEFWATAPEHYDISLANLSDAEVQALESEKHSQSCALLHELDQLPVMVERNMTKHLRWIEEYPTISQRKMSADQWVVWQAQQKRLAAKRYPQLRDHPA